jgi:hypothetical protein
VSAGRRVEQRLGRLGVEGEDVVELRAVRAQALAELLATREPLARDAQAPRKSRRQPRERAPVEELIEAVERRVGPGVLLGERRGGLVAHAGVRARSGRDPLAQRHVRALQLQSTSRHAHVGRQLRDVVERAERTRRLGLTPNADRDDPGEHEGAQDGHPREENELDADGEPVHLRYAGVRS